MKTSKIALLTFAWGAFNYGATLTAYALYKVLKDLGYEVNVLDYCGRYQRNSGLLEDKGRANFIDFRKTHMKYFYKEPNEKYSEYFKRANEYFDTFIVGSDQVWNLAGNRDTEKYNYFLSFTDNVKKRISYCSTMGPAKFSGDDFDALIVGMLLSRFAKISVREKSAKNLIINEFGLWAEHVLDPVFLVDKDFWLSLVKIQSPYANKTFYYVKNDFVTFDALHNDEFDKYLAPIEEWLAALSQSKLIVTDSYHALCFALIFNKPFCFIYNPNDFRFEKNKSLFEMFGLPLDKIITSFRDEITLDLLNKNVIDDYQFDFNKKLKNLKDFSLDFLINALKDDFVKEFADPIWKDKFNAYIKNYEMIS